jgi:enoyl-CoA hydratase
MTVVCSQVVDRIQHIHLNRPEKRNAIGYETLAELRRLLPTGEERALRGVVLSGHGEHFSAGADLQDLTGTAADIAFDDEMEGVISRIDKSPVPIIAAVSGYCFGAAVDLVMACDVRIADHSAIFRVPAVHLGLLYNPAAIARLHRVTPLDALHRLFVLGASFEAVDAKSAGLVSMLTQDSPRARAHELLSEGADPDPEAVAQTRQLIRALSSGARLDDQHWASMRHRLLESPSRKNRVARAQKLKDGTDDNSG